MARVSDPLRKFAKGTELVPGMSLRRCRDMLLELADRIDAEHERRMRQCRRETKRAAMRYLNSVIVDYAKHDMKRSRADMLARYERKGRR